MNVQAYRVNELSAEEMQGISGGSIPFWGGCTPDYDILINLPGRSERLRDGYNTAS
jgi:hypothetical protein